MSEKLDANKQLEARIAELKTYEGKTFIKKNSDGKQAFKVIRYDGIHSIRGGIRAHVFLVEASGPGGYPWRPVAAEFLNDYEEVQVKPQAAQEVI